MKKLIIICLLALTYTSTYAQEPTKKDAMDFIAKKFAANIVAPRRFHSYNDGVFKYYIPGGGGSICSFDLKKLTGWDHIIDPRYGNDYGIILKGKNLQIDGEGKIEDNWLTTFYDEDEGGYVTVINMKQEDGLTNRIITALNVLVTFNTKSDGDKF